MNTQERATLTVSDAVAISNKVLTRLTVMADARVAALGCALDEEVIRTTSMDVHPAPLSVTLGQRRGP